MKLSPSFNSPTHTTPPATQAKFGSKRDTLINTGLVVGGFLLAGSAGATAVTELAMDTSGMPTALDTIKHYDFYKGAFDNMPPVVETVARGNAKVMDTVREVIMPKVMKPAANLVTLTGEGLGSVASFFKVANRLGKKKKVVEPNSVKISSGSFSSDGTKITALTDVKMTKNNGREKQKEKNKENYPS